LKSGIQGKSKNLSPIYIWLFWQVVYMGLAILYSFFFPSAALEKQIPIWPPAQNFGLWLNRIFLSPFLRWDAVWYVQILTKGYIAGDGSTAFHPLYVLLGKPLYLLGINPELSLLIVSSLACLGLFLVFYKLASLDLQPEKSWTAVLLLSVFPTAFIIFAPYTESLFLFLVASALYFLRKRNWLLASLATFLAGLTRQQGVFLVFPMLWYIWEDSGKSLTGLTKIWRGWLATLSAPLGLIVWAIYRIGFLHEGTLDTKDWQGFIYSALISPSAKKTIPDQVVLWPWTAFIDSVNNAFRLMQAQGLINIFIGLVFVILFVLAWKYLSAADRFYCTAIMLISFSMSTGSFDTYIYLSLPRHLLEALPVFIGLSLALKKPWQRILVIGLQIPLQVFMLYLYVIHAWIP